MAITDPISLAYNAGTITLNRINQDNYGAEYFGEATNTRVTLTVKHTIPKPGQFGESHLCRINFEHYNATSGLLDRTISVWCAIRTDNGIQDQEFTEDATEALVDFLADATITKIVGRQS